MSEEIWKPIKGYEGLYQISNLGRVKSLEKTKLNNYKILEHILKPSKTYNGYLRLELSNKGIRKSHRINRLVAEAFIPNPNNYPVINHIDGNKQNNCVDNLEWCTQKENIIHSWKNGLSKSHNTKKKKLGEDNNGNN